MYIYFRTNNKKNLCKFSKNMKITRFLANIILETTLMVFLTPWMFSTIIYGAFERKIWFCRIENIISTHVAAMVKLTNEVRKSSHMIYNSKHFPELIYPWPKMKSNSKYLTPLHWISHFCCTAFVELSGSLNVQKIVSVEKKWNLEYGMMASTFNNDRKRYAP